ncbi:hypothetical protein PFISCL1PPCAC_19823, partial [Pristionchus fissidentatus]
QMSIVVGASSKVGKAVVTRLAFAGHRVVAVDSHSTELNNVEEEMRKVGADVTCIPFQDNEKSTIDKAASLLGMEMKGLVFIPPDNSVKGDVCHSTTIQFNTVFAQRLTLPFRMIKCAIPHLRSSADSSIVVINSSSAYTPFIDLGLYSAGSTALLALSRTLAIDPAILPIRVNTVLMSTVHGDGSGGVWDIEDEDVPLRDMMPLGRLGNSADVGAAVQFLLSTKSRYITGECLLLNGGMQLRL